MVYSAPETANGKLTPSEPNSHAATSRSAFQRTTKSAELGRFLTKNTPRTPKLSFGVSLGPQGRPGPPKSHLNGSRFAVILVPFLVFGNVNFSRRFPEMLFEPKGCHRECQGCADVSKRDTKSRPEVAMEASEGMSENSCFIFVKRYF